MSLLDVLFLLHLPALIFIFADIYLIFDRHSYVARTVRAELKPFMIYVIWPGLIVYNGANHNWFGFFIWMVNLAMLILEHDDDDRWKKRRKKALAKVKEQAGKLVVVPLPAPSAS